MKKEETGLVIKFSEPSEIPHIVKLIRESFNQNIIDKLIYGCHGINHFILKNLSDKFSQTKYISVLYDESLVAFCEYRETKDFLNLNYIAIDKDYQGKKLASKILRESLKLLNTSCNTIKLDVFDFNINALQWYINKGFRETGQNYWFEIDLDIYIDIDKTINISNEKEALIQYQMYGFCMLNVNGVRNCQVGLLGDKWIRITSAEIIDDIEVLKFLKYKYPERKFLGQFDMNIKEKEFDCIKILPILKSYKMEIDLKILK